MLQSNKKSLALQIFSPHCALAQRGHGRWRTHSGNTKGLICHSLKIGSQKIVSSLNLHLNCMHLGKVPQQIRPGNADISLLKSSVKINFKSQSQKTGHYMSNTGIIPVVKDRTYLKGAFFFPEDPLHSPKPFVGLSNLLGRKLRVGDKHKLPVKPGIFLNRLLINTHRASLYLQKPGKPFIAHQRFTSFILKQTTQTLQDR